MLVGDGVTSRVQVGTAALLAATAYGLTGHLFRRLAALAGMAGGEHQATSALAALAIPAGLSLPASAVVLGFEHAEGALPVAVSGAAGLIGQRAFAALGRRQRALERLHQVSDALSDGTHPSADPGELVHSVITQSLTLLNAQYAEIVCSGRSPDAGREAWTAWVGRPPRGPFVAEGYLRTLGGLPQQPRHLGTADEGDRQALQVRAVRRGMLAPLAAGGTRGYLLVADGIDGAVFTDADLRLLATVANQAAVALANAGLISRLQHEARRDELTGLPNRTYFRELIADSCAAEHADTPEPFAVMLLDFDGFKAVNDTLGHAAGDQLLCTIGARLAVAVDGVASVSRLGGDEFAVLAPGCRDERDAMALAGQLLGVFDQPVHVDAARLHLSGSLGIALFPEHGTDASDLLRNADLAMYAAKAGAGGARMFTDDLLDGNAQALTLGGDLRDAIARDEVEVVVHPLVQLSDEEVHSVEVLARWTHPELGKIDPEIFFSAAEQSGLTAALSVRILHRALGLCRDWLDHGLRVRVAVNVAPRWLADTTLPETVGAALAGYGVPADLLALELTERSVIADPHRVTQTLHRLRAMGVHLAVDDFGTGYSSLGYLSRLPVDQLKIDEVFVSRIAESERDLAIVRSLVDLGRYLKLEVVAEGVSSSVVRDLLHEIGCPLGQGYLFARPFEPEELDDFVTGRRALGSAV